MSKTDLYVCGGIDKTRYGGSALIISPNPAHGIINVELKNEIFISPVYSMYNSSGQQLFSGKAPLQKEFSVDIKGLKRYVTNGCRFCRQ
jgi:hypothetical protein